MKKFLPIIIIVIAVAVIATIGFFSVKIWKEKSGEIGIGGKSLMEIAEEQGEEIMSKQEWIKGCKESDPEAKDACYAMGAFYYRDASFCKNIKDAETRQECSQEKIEEAYKELEEMGMEEGYSGMTPMMPGGISGFLPYIPETEEESAGEEGESGGFGGGGAGETEEIYEISEEGQKEIEEALGKVSDEVKVEISAFWLYNNYIISNLSFEEGDPYYQKWLNVINKMDEILKKNNISDDVFNQILIEVQENPVLWERSEERYHELLEKGL